MMVMAVVIRRRMVPEMRMGIWGCGYGLRCQARLATMEMAVMAMERMGTMAWELMVRAPYFKLSSYFY